MVEDIIDVGKIETKGERYNPRIEQVLATTKSFLSYKSAVVGAVITGFYFLVAFIDLVHPALFGIPSGNGAYYNLANYSTYTNVTQTGTVFHPGLSHGFAYWLGGTTNNYPLLPAMFASLKLDLGDSFLIVLIGAFIGSILGVTAGYLGGLVDEAIMRITDVFFSVPFLVMAIAFTTIFGYGTQANPLSSAVYALIIIWWPIYARLSRSLALSTKSLNYVEAATAAGSSRIRNIFNHVFPNVLSPLFVQISLDLGSIIIIFASLGFLGITHILPSYPELGSLILQGDSFVDTFSYAHFGQWSFVMWWPLIIPGLFLLVFTVSINLFGDGLRDALDPKLRK